MKQIFRRQYLRRSTDIKVQQHTTRIGNDHHQNWQVEANRTEPERRGQLWSSRLWNLFVRHYFVRIAPSQPYCRMQSICTLLLFLFVPTSYFLFSISTLLQRFPPHSILTPSHLSISLWMNLMWLGWFPNERLGPKFQEQDDIEFLSSHHSLKPDSSFWREHQDLVTFVVITSSW
jgi:hypothetical protein